MMKMKRLLEKYHAVITYIFFSCVTAVIELVIGLFFLNVFDFSEVAANTCGIIIGSVVHYICVTKKSFRSDVSIGSAVVYLITFFLGMALQNFVVWLVFGRLENLFNENIVYTIAKGISLAVSFVVLYQIRKLSYKIINKNKEKKDE